MIGSPVGNAQRPQQRTHEVARYPAPQGGMDIRQAIGSEDLNTCVYTYNLLPFEYGLRVRPGYQEWQIGLDDGNGLGVHTLIPYDSAQDSGAGDSLFAVTNEGIWNVGVYAATPVLLIAFADQSADAGYGTYAHYVDDSGDDVLFYADSLNGLYTYDAQTSTWAVASGIVGPVIADIKFIVSHKQRLWMIEENSTKAWYLEIGSNSGQATEFFFGSKFKHGGTLEGLFSWTVDGGAGVDDLLVAVSHAGDVLVYQGSDPDLTDWEQRGTYFIGEIPNTPRFGTETGGELFLLSVYGIISMSDLLNGVDTSILQSDVEGSTMAYKIAGLLREQMRRTIELKGWEVTVVPSDGGILISTPTIGSAAPIQYYYNVGVQAWGLWRGVPMSCFDEYSGAVVFGTADGRVCRMDVEVDEKKLTPMDPQFNGDAIEFSILTSFTSFGQPAVYKRPKLIRPDFISQKAPIQTSVVRFDFDTSEGLDFGFSTPDRFNVGTWDADNWDFAVWGSQNGTTFPSIGGSWGTGRYMAIATKGNSRTATRLIGWDLIYDTGGPMI